MFSGIILLSICVSCAYSQGTEALKGKKVLFVYGGWDGHEPKQCRDIFVPWLQSAGAEVFVYDNLSCYANKELMNSIDLIVQTWTQGTIGREESNGLLSAVKRGVGLAGWHGGIGDSFRDNVDFQYMVGGQWVAHPGGVIPYEVIITDQNDPVTKGLKDFRMNSEQYYMHVDPNTKVLATTKFSADHDFWVNGAVIPVVWKKTFGKGRVFYSSLGHVAKDFDVPEALEIMKRGICWAAMSLHEKTEACLIHSVYSQGLTQNQKEKIVSEITADFEKNIKAAENLDAKGLTDCVDDTFKAGFINNGNFLNSFDEVMKGFNEEIKGVKSLKYSISNKKITVLADNAALLTVSGNASLALEDGRTFTGGFAWTFVYSKVNGNWKIIHTHMSTPR